MRENNTPTHAGYVGHYLEKPRRDAQGEWGKTQVPKGGHVQAERERRWILEVQGELSSPGTCTPSWSKGLTQDSEDALEVCEAVKT